MVRFRRSRIGRSSLTTVASEISRIGARSI
jgi:hypothetical protein